MLMAFIRRSFVKMNYSQNSFKIVMAETGQQIHSFFHPITNTYIKNKVVFDKKAKKINK